MAIEKQPVEQVIDEFRGKLKLLERACRETRSLIEQILDSEKITVSSVTARPKSEPKLREKYQRPDKSYTCLDDITDQIGIRITTYYEDQVDTVSKIIAQNFTVHPEHTADKRTHDPERFGYQSLHYVCSYAEPRASLAEYRQFSGVRFEVQIRSILQHAWAEMEHDTYDLRGDVPANIKRRFARLAGLLELADQEFIEVRKAREQYVRSVSVMIEANALNASAVDALSVQAFIKEEPLIAKLDSELSEALGLPISSKQPEGTANNVAAQAKILGIQNLDELRNVLRAYESPFLEFSLSWIEMRQEWRKLKSSMAAGLSLVYILLMVIAARGPQPLTEYQRHIGPEYLPESKIEDVASLAHGILTKRGMST
jgi:putative GTP pyrophosphokinase